MSHLSFAPIKIVIFFPHFIDYRNAWQKHWQDGWQEGEDTFDVPVVLQCHACASFVFWHDGCVSRWMGGLLRVRANHARTTADRVHGVLRVGRDVGVDVDIGCRVDWQSDDTCGEHGHDCSRNAHF
jgi:hypothetical protein